MKPYYDAGGIQIYHGDCREILPSVAADALVTDPPYGLGERWQGGTWGANPMYADARKWDLHPFHGLEALAAQFKTAIIWGGNFYSFPPSRCWLSWEKSSRMDTMADFELAWTNLDRPSKAWREDRNPDGKREHPTQKPLSLMLWCLGFVPSGIVLDPFAGSGTTLLAAKQLNRRAIGIEIEERYCEIAARRLSQEVLSFAPKKKPSTDAQTSLLEPLP
jgi:site-specific DNA-methyltransferase (adenine-specific)